MDAERPLWERRAWGEYTVLEHVHLATGVEALTKHLSMIEGGNFSYQYHRHRSEVWVMLSGEAELILDDTITKVTAGDVVRIACGAKHSLRALTAVEFIEVQQGSPLVETDIERLAITWEEILELLGCGEAKGRQ